MTGYSRIETEVSDRLLIYSIKNKLKYPSRHCITLDESTATNTTAIESMKNGETILLRQASVQLVAQTIINHTPNISKFFAVENYRENHGGDFPTVDAIDFPDLNNLSIDFVSVHKENGKYIFRALEANGHATHSTSCASPQQLINDAMKEEVLRVLGVEKKHVSEGVLDSSDKEQFLKTTIEWLADHRVAN